MHDATLCFLIKEDNNKIEKICLAMKKRGFGVNRWNGAGGKVEKKETIEQALVREVEEEISVRLNKYYKIADLSFTFPKNKEWNQRVHVYFCDKWSGTPEETEEMKPKWFSIDKIPYNSMWPDDIYWLPDVLNKKLIQASFIFDKGDIIKQKDVKTVNSL